jgi:mediator of RNA polymerase II transcription subunit 10
MAELEEVRNQLQQIIETQIELGIMIHDYPATVEAKEGLVERLKIYGQQLSEINNASLKLKDTLVPLDVVEYIDNGRNPDVYTREFVELLAKQNQYIKGKLTAMAQFRDILGTQIKETYPDLASAVDEVLS